MNLRLPHPLLFALTLLPLLAACASAPPPLSPHPAEADVQSLSRAARAALDRDALLTAASLFQQALRRAQATDRPDLIAPAAYNLAALRALEARPTEALELLDLTQSLAPAGSPLALDADLLRAATLRTLPTLPSDSPALLNTINRVLNPAPPAAPTPTQAALAHTLLGEFHVENPDLAALPLADEQLARARAILAPTPTPDPLTLARTFDLESALATRRKDHAAAARAADTAVDLLKSAPAYHLLPTALERAASAHAAAGNTQAAADRLFRAADAALAPTTPSPAALALARRAAAKLADLPLEEPSRARADALNRRLLTLSAIAPTPP